jgi:ATP-binding cassette, subfamily B, bacterial MsbA
MQQNLAANLCDKPLALPARQRHIARKFMSAFLFKVWNLARPYRIRLFLGVLMGIFTGLIAPLMIATIVFVYNEIFPSTNSPATLPKSLSWVPAAVQDWIRNAQESLGNGLHTHPAAVIALVALIPAVIFLNGLLGYMNMYFLQWVAIRAITDLRVRLFTRLMSLSAGFFSGNQSGELISRITNDTTALQVIFSNVTSSLVKDPITLVSLLAYLFYLQPKLTAISLIVVPACTIPIAIYSRKIRQSSRALQSHVAELTQVMNESFTGNRIVKAYNLEDAVAGQFRDTARKFIGHYMRIIRSIETPGPLIEFLGSIGVSLVLLYLFYHTQTQTKQADFLRLILSIFMMYQPMKNLTRLHNQIVQARAASERIFDLLAMQNSVPEPNQPKMLQADGADIQFDRVDFAYGDKPVLQNIKLQIKSGQLVALVGASGSGKTTVANLLLRFYDPTRGVIRIGDVDIRDVSTRDLRNQIAVVTQETVLFNDTIRKNIELGRPGATNEEIISAAKHANAHQFILEKPDGYDTVIGEKGVLLSGGQRQRLAIARAVLKNAPILILDEATSSLDTESERAVQAALDQLMQGRTTLCIAHRLSTILHADVIVVLDQGRIVETGGHEELVKRGGVYQKLYELQFLNFPNLEVARTE